MVTKKEVFDKYLDTVNMSFEELKAWANDPCSNAASLDRSPIKRNLRLLRKSLKDWTVKDINDAKRTISFVARMKAVSAGKPVCGGESKRTIALKNWAFDPNK